MAVAVTGSKTITTALAPHLSASALTTLLATPIESLKLSDMDTLMDIAERVPQGARTKTLAQLLA